MIKKQPLYKKSLFIFRRDLRLHDNTALNNALEQSEVVIPCFIFDPQQVTQQNDYFSANAVQFMIESLQSLNKELIKKNGQLYFFYGKPHTIVEILIKDEKIDALFVNCDYTPFSIMRDAKIEKLCIKNHVAFKSYSDALLNSPEKILKKDKTFYSIFTAFYNNAHLFPVAKPHNNRIIKFFTGHIKNTESENFYAKIAPPYNKKIHIHGGVKNGLAILNTLQSFKHYMDTHNDPNEQTSNLSAHLKFGTLSIRHVYHTVAKQLGKNHPLIRQLYWRDFFTYIAYHNPRVFGNAFHEKYNKIPWNTDQEMFNTWCTGTTGFPIVDAGMRQLNTTGFMHNRVRMIAASFLVKDLHINWLWGEKYFAQKLVDYDPAVNNGNWQWIASTGCDAQPYFRIFNPWLQQKKYDPDCAYIKKWVPELRNLEPKAIHNWFKENRPYCKNYPIPMVDHAIVSKQVKRMYKR